LAVPAAAQPEFTDQNFEMWVFQQDQNAAGARKRLDAQLTLHVDAIDRACKLTDPQKKKLRLAGRGDIKRVFDLYDVAKQKFQVLKQVHQKEPEKWQDNWQKMWQDISPIQQTLQAGVFHDDSLLLKSVRHALTAEQLPRYEALARERRAFRHQAAIGSAVQTIEQTAPLRDAQRRALIALLERETKPARKAGTYESYVIMVQFGRLPEAKLKPLFDNSQWKAVSQVRNQYRGMEQWLKQSGQLPDDDDEAAKPPARPAVKQKGKL
jgi:hypothetical protein